MFRVNTFLLNTHLTCVMVFMLIPYLQNKLFSRINADAVAAICFFYAYIACRININ